MGKNARIRSIGPENAEGALKESYATISPGGNIANILRVQSLDPEALSYHYALYRRLMFGPSPLSRAEREAMAVAVSRANECQY